MAEIEALKFLVEPFGFLADPGKRVYWLYILVALFVASFVTCLRDGGFFPRKQVTAFVNYRYWFNRSTIIDYVLMWLNALVRSSLIVPLLGAKLAGALVVARFFQVYIGDIQITGLHWAVIASIFSVVLFVADDLSRFFLHRVMHKVPALWKLHKLHHSATTLTPFTVFRVHPVESILYTMRGFLVFSGLAGFFIWLFKGQLTAFDILGVDALGFLFNLAAANLRHSHVPVTFGPVERYVVSPLQHQLHHSRDHLEVNFGACFSLWDRWSGTLLLSKDVKHASTLRFGLSRPRLASPEAFDEVVGSSTVTV